VIPSFPYLRRPAVAACLLALGVALAGCAGRSVTAPPPEPQVAPGPPVELEQPNASPSAPVEGAPLAELAQQPGKVGIALLLPLSGPNAGLGRALLEAAEMAVFDAADERFELLPRDTQGTPDGAAKAAQAALVAGARLILGPLLQQEVEAVRPIARGANVNLVAFSTSTSLAGDGTWLLSFLPQQQVDRVVAFAHDKGLNRFAALAPATPYGDLVVQELRSATTAAGASVVRVETYDPNAVDVSPAVRSLASAVRQTGEADFDALMLPEGGQKLKGVAPMLPFYDIDTAKVRLLGTGLWDEPGLGREPALVGGWFAAPPPEARADFEKHYQELYKRRPPRLATLGYDAAALAAVLARGGDFSAAAITNPSGFAGVDGIFRFAPNGLVQRGLAVLEVTRDGTNVVSPAPETFEQTAF
jgi:ABC-type branched-subunit amino acid transport system substrate-binding protein